MTRRVFMVAAAPTAALLAALTFALPNAPSQQQRESLLYPRPQPLSSLPLPELERWQVRALAHYRGAYKAHERVADRRALSRREFTHRRWYRLASLWSARELRETRERLRLRREWTAGPSSGMWYEIAKCESSLGTGRPQWHINTGNGFYGGLQYDHGTWLEAQRNLGVHWTEYAHLASPGQQVRAAQTLPLTRWPRCGAPYR